MYYVQDFPHSLELGATWPNPECKWRRGQFKENDWKCSRSNKVHSKQAARQDVINVMQESLKVGLVRESKAMTQAHAAHKKNKYVLWRCFLISKPKQELPQACASAWGHSIISNIIPVYSGIFVKVMLNPTPPKFRRKACRQCPCPEFAHLRQKSSEKWVQFRFRSS